MSVYICLATIIVMNIIAIFIMMSVGFIESIFEIYKFDINCSFYVIGDFKFECSRFYSCNKLSGMQILFLSEYDKKACDDNGHK